MPTSADAPVGPVRSDRTHPLARIAAVLALLFLFLLGVNGLGDGFKALGSDALEAFFSATSNPFIGLMVGILATTLVQSSSVSTSLIVGLVAAPVHPLPIANAVPMIMGANIGTTVTNTLVSLGHIRRRDEFQRAFAVATCHDFFNFMAVAILLPLELATGLLRRLATAMTGALTGMTGVDYDSPLKDALKATWDPVKDVLGATVGERTGGILLIVISGILIYVALTLLVRVMRTAVQTRVESIVARGLEKSALIGIVVGIVVTVMVQSSSITTSLLVPLAGAGLLTVTQAFPVTVGANIGTTVTALLAALAATGPNARYGLTIALVHLLFNLTATGLIFPVQRIRDLPIRAAERLAAVAVKSRRWAILYVLLLFYGIPALFALLNQLL